MSHQIMIKVDQSVASSKKSVELTDIEFLRKSSNGTVGLNDAIEETCSTIKLEPKENITFSIVYNAKYGTEQCRLDAPYHFYSNDTCAELL